MIISFVFIINKYTGIHLLSGNVFTNGFHAEFLKSMVRPNPSLVFCESGLLNTTKISKGDHDWDALIITNYYHRDFLLILPNVLLYTKMYQN